MFPSTNSDLPYKNKISNKEQKSKGGIISLPLPMKAHFNRNDKSDHITSLDKARDLEFSTLRNKKEAPSLLKMLLWSEC